MQYMIVISSNNDLFECMRIRRAKAISLLSLDH